jgi:2-keto-4-pentenoate hydratase/2-oxohepta-3-ene-1,7-dioic acid hydratase in catechol pathway
MKLCRYDYGRPGPGEERLGWVDGDRVRDVTSALDALPAVRYPLPRFDPLVAGLGALRPAIEAAAAAATPVPLASVRLLSPVANPGKVIAAPVNYRKHLEEALADKGIHHGNLVEEIHRIGLFLKATSSVAGPGEGLRLIRTDRRNDHEVELAVVIGKAGRNIARADALAHVAGYCIGLDITIRGPEERSLRKSPDGYCVLGPWLSTADEIPDPSRLQVSIRVNGALRQDANTAELVLPVPALIEMASSFYTLHPGDVILTGTPQGVGPLQPGDLLRAGVDAIGSMEVKVSAA